MKRYGLLAALIAAPLCAQVNFHDILKGPGANWLTYAGDYSSQRHSPLKQITAANASRLTPKWTYHVENSRRLETTPLVYDGVMYITGTNEVHAIDARTGRRIWLYHDDQATRQGVNRGVALLGNRVFFVTSDAHLVALDRRTGGVLWQTQYAPAGKGYSATLAPMALRDRVIVGVGGGDGGIRGFVAAYSATTGEELWRYWTVPAKGQPGAESWGGFPADYAGGATWMTGSYDPALDLVFGEWVIPARMQTVQNIGRQPLHGRSRF